MLVMIAFRLAQPCVYSKMTAEVERTAMTMLANTKSDNLH